MYQAFRGTITEEKKITEKKLTAMFFTILATNSLADILIAFILANGSKRVEMSKNKMTKGEEP